MAAARLKGAEFKEEYTIWQDTPTQYAVFAAEKIKSSFLKATDATQINAAPTAGRTLRDSTVRDARRIPSMGFNYVKSKRPRDITGCWKGSFTDTLI
jgi:hypothetical protein